MLLFFFCFFFLFVFWTKEVFSWQPLQTNQPWLAALLNVFLPVNKLSQCTALSSKPFYRCHCSSSSFSKTTAYFFPSWHCVNTHLNVLDHQTVKMVRGLYICWSVFTFQSCWNTNESLCFKDCLLTLPEVYTCWDHMTSQDVYAHGSARLYTWLQLISHDLFDRKDKVVNMFTPASYCCSAAQMQNMGETFNFYRSDSWQQPCLRATWITTQVHRFEI